MPPFELPPTPSFSLLPTSSPHFPGFSTAYALPEPTPTASPIPLPTPHSDFLTEVASIFAEPEAEPGGMFSYIGSAASRMGTKMWGDIRLFGGALSAMPGAATRSTYNFVTGLPDAIGGFLDYSEANFRPGNYSIFTGVSDLLSYSLWSAGGSKPETLHAGGWTLFADAVSNTYEGAIHGVSRFWNGFDTAYRKGDFEGAGARVGELGGAALPSAFALRAWNYFAPNGVRGVLEGVDRFDIEPALARAQAAQLSAKIPYNADKWTMTPLKKGDLVFGALPGQTGFYTDLSTFASSGLSRSTLGQLLQIAPSPSRGYRPYVMAYEVVEDIEVPSGFALANPQLGTGNGFQYHIEDFVHALRPIGEKFDLGD